MDENISVQVTAEEVLRGKFSGTLTTIEGFYKEAENSEEEYSSSSVYDRIETIKEVFERELEALAEVMIFQTKNSK